MSSFREMINDKPDQIQKVATALRDLMLSPEFQLDEAILGGDKVKLAYYNYGEYNNAVGVISPAKNHCKLFLHHIHNINSANFTFEGKGKHSKHVKFQSLNDENLKNLKILVGQVVDIVKSKSG